MPSPSHVAVLLHSSSRRTLQAALLTVLVAVGLTAGAAEAKVPRAFYGVEGDPVGLPTSQADFNRMRSARVGDLRIDFHWASVEPTQGVPRDWSYYDTIVERAARARVGILAVLVGSPHFAAESEPMRRSPPPGGRRSSASFAT